MSKKLLNESTVRRFMGLANLAPLSESFLDNQVNEEEDITESEETVDEEVVEEAALTTNEKTEVQEEGLIGLSEDDEEEDLEDEIAVDAIDSGDDMEAAADDIEAATDDMAAAEGDGDIAARAEQILGDLAALINQAAGAEVVTVSATDGGAEADMEADAAMDMGDAAMDVEDAGTDALHGAEDEEELEEPPLAETGAGLTGASEDDESKTHPGKDYNESKQSSVDALVAEITSKVLGRLSN
jgi:hypothetical protein